MLRAFVDGLYVSELLPNKVDKLPLVVVVKPSGYAMLDVVLLSETPDPLPQLPATHAPAEPTAQEPSTSARPVGVFVPLLITIVPEEGQVTEPPPVPPLSTRLPNASKTGA